MQLVIFREKKNNPAFMGLQYMRGVISYNVDVLADHPRKYLRRIKSNADTLIFSYRCKYRCFSYSVWNVWRNSNEK